MFPEGFMWMINASTATCVAKQRRPILRATPTEAIPTYLSNRRMRKKKLFAKRRWKVAR
jgi:hypothetical protein